MRYYILLILGFLTLCVSSQKAPGYMGKHLSLGYSNYFFPSIIGPTANAKSTNNSFGINTTHCFNLEYTIMNRTNFCLTFQKSKTGVNPSGLTEEFYEPAAFTYQFHVYTYRPEPYLPMQMTSTNFGAGFKFFKSGSLAPIGKYYKLELLVMFNQLKYDKNAFEYYDTKTSSSGLYGTVGKGEYKVNSFAIAYSLGRSRVMFDRLLLDCGLRFGVTPVRVISFLIDDFTSDGNNSSFNPEKTFSKDAQNRLFRFQAINFHVGLGFLAF